jgi:hypothetical protein
MGFFWTVNEEKSILLCRQSFRRAEVPVNDFETESCRRTFQKGQGLPGRVWSSGRPAWILDIAHDANFPRLDSAVSSGLHSAFACPVVVADQILGVIEFFTKRIHEPDADAGGDVAVGAQGHGATVAPASGQLLHRRPMPRRPEVLYRLVHRCVV